MGRDLESVENSTDYSNLGGGAYCKSMSSGLKPMNDTTGL